MLNRCQFENLTKCTVVALILAVDEKAVKLILQNVCYAATMLLVMFAILI